MTRLVSLNRRSRGCSLRVPPKVRVNGHETPLPLLTQLEQWIDTPRLPCPATRLSVVDERKERVITRAGHELVVMSALGNER
jgi:hypothetical protein